MKKCIYPALLLLASAGAAQAQTGNVGIGTSTPGSKLTVNGSFAAAYNAVSGNYTMSAADYYVVSNSASNSTITLPAAMAAGSGNYKGRLYEIKNTHTSSTLTITGNGAELIDDIGAAGVASVTVMPGDGVLLVSNGNTSGTTWEVVSYHSAIPSKDYDWMKVGNQVPTAAADTGNTIYHIGGKVGIGRSSPLNTLHVHATADDTSLFFAPNVVARFDPFGGSNIAKAATIILNGGRSILGYEPNSAVSKYAFFRTNNSTDLRLQVYDNNSVFYHKSFVMSSQGSAAGFIGLNIESPQARLDIRGTLKVMMDTIVQTGNFWNGTSNVNGFEISSGAAGDVFVGIQRTTGNSANLHLAKAAGAVVNSAFLGCYVNGSTVGTITYNGAGITYGNTSDRRLKENIRPSAQGLASLLKMEVKDYSYISDEKKALHTGFLAQDLYKIFPQAVIVGGLDAKTDPWQVDYSKLTPVLVKAVQELNDKVEALEQENARLKTQQETVAQMAEELKELRQMMGMKEKGRGRKIASR